MGKNKKAKNGSMDLEETAELLRTRPCISLDSDDAKTVTEVNGKKVYAVKVSGKSTVFWCNQCAFLDFRKEYAKQKKECPFLYSCTSRFRKDRCSVYFKSDEP